MKLSALDWCSAACADAVVEALPINALVAAREVSTTPKDFFWAVQGAVLLQDTIKLKETQ